MAISLEANYSKKLGLPGYSSHQYSVTIRTELTDLSSVDAESARLYALLQTCVDREIQETGYLPGANSSSGNSSSSNNGNGHGNGKPHAGINGNGASSNSSSTNNDAWTCSDKQKSLILKIVEENHLDKREIDALAQDRFGKRVRALNKMEASGFIEELLETHAAASNGSQDASTPSSAPPTHPNGFKGRSVTPQRFQKARPV